MIKKFHLQDPCLPRLNLYRDRKSTRLNSSHSQISYAVFCLKKKKKHFRTDRTSTRMNCSHSQISKTVFCLKKSEICRNNSTSLCSKKRQTSSLHDYASSISV